MYHICEQILFLFVTHSLPQHYNFLQNLQVHHIVMYIIDMYIGFIFIYLGLSVNTFSSTCAMIPLPKFNCSF